MKPIDYFKKTFMGVFVFIIVYKTVVQLFDGLSGFTLKFGIKLFLAAFLTATTLGVLNYFFKVGFKRKTTHN